ncbi:MAG TPA: NAD-dependent epimerase/dehydratase family protein [Victivallales bacterium]|nr:NAD-dependent epimerase/dehydratase family protein [Victivallales bacterium]
MKVLITGGAGFVGANLAIAIKENYPESRVTSLDNLYRKGSELNLQRLAKHGVRFLKGDVRSKRDIESAGEADFLIECSAEPSVLAGKDGGVDYLVGTNLYGAVNCAEFCRKNGSTMIFLSTSRVYPIKPLLECEIRKGRRRFDFADRQKISGLSAYGVSEDFPMQGVRSLYGATKYAAETMLIDYADAFKFNLLINRFGVIAGPWQFGKSDQGIAPFWLASHMFRKKIKYIGFGGTGRQVRDFLHIDDAVKLILMQMRKPAKFAINNSKGMPFNVGGGKENSASLLELTDLCRGITGQKIEIGSELETRYADIPVYISDSRKIISLCGWKPRKNIKNILSDIHEWIKNTPSAQKIFG